MAERLDAGPILTGAFFVVAVLVIWTQAQPFPSLMDYGVLNDPTQSNELRKYLTLAIAGAALLMVVRHGQTARLWQSVSPGLLAVFGWFALTSLISSSPALALNRLVLAGVVIAIAFCLPLLFDRVEHFATALGISASIAIALCFYGVIFLPDLAIHQARDTVEQALAGDWRGVFKHKNDLAPMAIHFVFIGILLFRISSKLWGTLAICAAAILLVMSGGKSAALLIIPATVGAALMVRLRSTLLTNCLAIAIVGGLALITVGSVAFPAVGALVAHLPDPSFTGRADIWSLGLDAIANRPLTGYGYNVFWDTGLTYEVASTGSTAALVSHAHNGFIEVTISAGIGGLILVLLWAGIAPLRHIAIIKPRLTSPADRAFFEFLVQGWLFTLLISSLETVLFNRGDSIWFSGLLSIVCLRLWSRAKLRSAP